MLVCIGRQPNSYGIGLENIRVQTDEKGWIVTDDHMKTYMDNVYAIGDIFPVWNHARIGSQGGRASDPRMKTVQNSKPAGH